MNITSNRPFSAAAACALLFIAVGSVVGQPGEFAGHLDPGELKLSPSKPNASFPGEGDENRLSPNTSIIIAVKIEETGIDDKGIVYQLKGEPTITGLVFGEENLWTGEPGTDTTYMLTNTAKNHTLATLTVSCEWEPVLYGNGGSGPRPDNIPGLGYAIIELEETVATFEFDREIAIYNLADHEEKDRRIEFTLSFTDTAARNLSSDQISEIEITFAEDIPAPLGGGLQPMNQGGGGGGGSGLISQVTEPLEPNTNHVRGFIEPENPEVGGTGSPIGEFNHGSPENGITGPVGPLALPPVTLAEFAPLMRDEDRNEIAGSGEPQPDRHPNPLVKRQPPNPATDDLPGHAEDPRMAWREVRIRVGDGIALEGEVVTWSLQPTFGHPAAQEPDFRGTWEASTPHENRFEEAVEFDAHNFTAVSQEQATTTIDAEGYTAIRVNLPPHGLNSAAIVINMDSLEEPMTITEVFVPIVVVIDPGHGDTHPGASYNHTWQQDGVPVTVQVTEREVVMVLSDLLVAELQARRSQVGAPFSFARFHLTRSDNTTNPPFVDRARTAGNLAADIFLSIHTNAFNGTVRGIETFYRAENNNDHVNDDIALAQRISAAALSVWTNSVLRGDNQGAKPDPEAQHNGLTVLRQDLYNNTASYKVVRGVLHEVEFLDNLAAFQEVWGTGEQDAAAAANRQALVESWADAILTDIVYQPAP